MPEIRIERRVQRREGKILIGTTRKTLRPRKQQAADASECECVRESWCWYRYTVAVVPEPRGRSTCTTGVSWSRTSAGRGGVVWAAADAQRVCDTDGDIASSWSHLCRRSGVYDRRRGTRRGPGIENENEWNVITNEQGRSIYASRIRPWRNKRPAYRAACTTHNSWIMIYQSSIVPITIRTACCVLEKN